MKISIQYVNDLSGNTTSVQLPINDWNRVLNKLNKYEQSLKLKSDLKIALDEVKKLKNKNTQKQTLTDFLNEI
jgi:predicted DNA-binding protein YlxM (UPF0122 family)